MSKWMQYRSPGRLEQAEAKVNEILGRNQQMRDEKIQCIRNWFAYYDLVDVATMLELAIWKANMGVTEQDAEARQASRQNCGSDMNVIIPGVLSYSSVPLRLQTSATNSHSLPSHSTTDWQRSLRIARF